MKTKKEVFYMKKNNFFLLLAASVLVLSACGHQPSKQSTPEGGSSEPEQSGYVDPVIDLDDAETPNMEIAFDEIEDTCMVNKQAKTYIDAMEEQEKTLDKPYHFSSLYGPDDYAKLAAAADKGDGTTYAAEDTGGVDVCQILRNTDDSGYCKNYPIKLTWDDDGSFENAKVKFWSTEDQSDLRETGVTVKDGKVVAELANLFRARKYRVQVVNDGDVSQGYEFTTGDYPRTISFGGIKNVRDIGGFVTSYGVRTTQGLIYRGYYIDDGNPSSHGKNYNEETQRVQEEVLKIGLELDLQKSSETGGRTKSAIDSEAIPVEYKCKTLVSYDNFLKQDSYQNLPEVFHDLAQADETHVYFHCWGGADRTGMLDFFVNAILGVSYTDLIEEFELTTQTNNKRCHMHNSSSAHYAKFINAFVNGTGINWQDYDPEKTVNENCYAWLVDVAQVDPDDIERIREIMLPGYADGDLDEKKLIPSYTAEEEWQSDELSGWQKAKEDANVKCNWHRHKGTPCSVCNHGAEDNPQPSSSQPSGEVDYTLPIGGRVWTESAPQNNSDGKPFIQMNDASNNKSGVKIKFADFGSGSTATVSGGKINPQGDTSVYLEYKIKAPKAGAYQLVMNGRVSDSGLGKTLSERSFKVILNGENVAIENTRTDVLTADGDNDFVAAPTINLTGNEDTVRIACSGYRIVFTDGSYLTFIEH